MASLLGAVYREFRKRSMSPYYTEDDNFLVVAKKKRSLKAERPDRRNKKVVITVFIDLPSKRAPRAILTTAPCEFRTKFTYLAAFCANYQIFLLFHLEVPSGNQPVGPEPH